MSPELHQQLLELAYDLLTAEEAADLKRRIETEPALANAWKHVRQDMEILGRAARLDHEPLKLRCELGAPAAVELAEHQAATAGGLSGEKASAGGQMPHARPEKRGVNRLGSDDIPLGPTVTASGQRPAGRDRALDWTLALAAAVLLMASIGGYWYELGDATVADDYLRLVVTGPAVPRASVENHYSVHATSAAGRPLPAKVTSTLFSPDGRELWQRQTTADDKGRLEIGLPADDKLQTGARLEFVAAYGEASERVETRVAVAPERHQTHLSVDKPLYQPGETIYYRSLTLSQFGLAADRELTVHFELHDPSGAVVPGSELTETTVQGVGNGSFAIPAEMAGGAYQLIATSPEGAFPKEEREVFIRQYRLPRLKTQLEFARDSYAPGEKVVADFSAVRAEGGPAAGAQLSITATVDGQVVHQSSSPAAADGTSRIEFSLPAEIQAGAGLLAVAVDDGGTQETIAKKLPINLGKVTVEFFPEGGDLVAGLDNRVYFVGRDPLGKPVHVEGRVLDSAGQEVASVQTTHEGLGSFRFKPRAGETYSLAIDTPAGVTNQTALPATSEQGWLTLDTGPGVFEARQPIELKLASLKQGRPLVVAAYCRGVEVGQQAMVGGTDVANDHSANGTQPAELKVSIELGDDVGGVVRLTAYDYGVQPPAAVAERLVYRRPAKQLRVELAEGSDERSPGEKARLRVRVLDEHDRPRAAALGVAVVDDALLNLADDDTPRMTTHFRLASELSDPAELEDLDFYLSDDAGAAEALDLLLGTQGWRRFAEQTFVKQTPVPGQPAATTPVTRLAELGELSSPPAVFDNVAQIEPRYRSALATVQKERRELLARAGLIAAALLWLVVVVLLAVRALNGVWTWLPVTAAALASLLIAVGRFQPAKLAARQRQVAFHEFRLEPQPVPISGPRDAVTMNGGGAGGGIPAGGMGMGGPMGPAGFGGMNARLGVPADANQALEQADRPVDLRVWRFGDTGYAMDGASPLNFGLGFGGDQYNFVNGRFGDQPQDFAFYGRLATLNNGLEARMYRRLMPAGEPGPAAREMLGGRGRGAGIEGVDGADLAKLAAADQKQPAPIIRQYAHAHRAGPPGMRVDFTETLYWNPLLLADEQGEATIEFDLSDAVTSFRLAADAHGGGRIGSSTSEIVSRLPFSLEPKLPLEVNAGDIIDLPVAVVNETQAELPVKLALAIAPAGDAAGEATTAPLRLDGEANRGLTLGGRQRRREHFRLEITGQKGEAALRLSGEAGPLTDAVERRLRIVPPGFPVSLSYGGKIAGEQEVNVALPDDWVPGSLAVTLSAYPSSLADIERGLEGILQEPNGCFEQASSSNYPNVLTLQYLQQHRLADPTLTRRARDLLKSGYPKLAGYECAQHGYEWFGGDPGHEALTAYGLLEFRDMAEVYDVDRSMLDRTAAWLRSRRDGQGGFKRNDRALDSFGGAPADITDAYITWALAESGENDLAAELNHVAGLAQASDDPYLVALAGAAAVAAGDERQGRPLLVKLAKSQADDGHLTGKNGSITRSGGLSLDVETTALAALAWLKHAEFAAPAERAIGWLVSHRQGQGGFGSTQATILALKALVAHAQSHQTTVSGGELVVRRDDQTIARQTFAAGEHHAIEVSGIAAHLTPGDNQLTISLSGDNQMPYGLDVSYRVRRPPSDVDCAVRLTTELAREKIAAGATVALTAELENTRDEGQPMTVAVLGLPAGLEPRPKQLDELKDAGTLDYYELRAREVICYWRSLAPRRKVELRLDLVAEVPGSYTGPASRAYLYYTAEKKCWEEPLAIEIALPHDAVRNAR